MGRSVWPVLVAATGGIVIGHWLMMAGILIDAGDGDDGAGGQTLLLGAGLVVVAGTVVASARASGAGGTAGVMAAAAGGIVMGAVWFVRSDEVPLPAIVAGVATAAALAVHRQPRHELWVRLLMVVLIFGYVWWVTEFAAAFAIIVTPLLPYPTVGVADYASQRGAGRHVRSGYAAPE
jgi:hypothetical protein